MRTEQRVGGVLLIFLFLWVIQTKGQVGEMRFQYLTVDDGLSQGVVQCIYQDSQGFLWFGTQDGLNRYDGFRFKVFKNDPTDSTSISNNFIRSVCEDKFNNFWIATTDGLNKYDFKTETFTRYKNNEGDSNTISSDDIMVAYPDSAGAIWIGTQRGGLNRFDQSNNKFTRISDTRNNNTQLSIKSIGSICEDTEDRLWLGIIGGVARYDKKSGSIHYFPTYDKKYDKQRNTTYSIALGENGILWLGMGGAGIIKFNTRTSTFTRIVYELSNPKSLSSNVIWNLHIETNNLFLVATENGLNIFNERSGEFRRIMNNPQDPKSLSNNNVVSIFKDRGGIYWIGTYGNGINKYNPLATKFSQYKLEPQGPNNFSDKNIWCFYEDSHGVFWTGTESGLNKYEQQTGKSSIFKHNPQVNSSISGNIVTAINEDRNGYLWFGTRGTGLNKFDRNTGRFDHHFQYFDILNLFTDSDTLLWIGTTTDGLIRFNTKTEKYNVYKHSPTKNYSIGNNAVGIIVRDRNGTLWCGTYGGGLNKFDLKAERFIRYKNNSKNLNSLSNDIVTSIYEDSSGIMWIGTAQGLNRFNPIDESFTRFYEKDGLPNDFIYGILPDENENMWISTNRGITRFNYSLHKQTGNGFKNFDIKDGLQGNEFNAGAFYKSRTGEMFFGGPNGFNQFFPDKIPTNQNIPPIVITSFKVMDKDFHFGRSLCEDECIELSYRDYYFSIEFAALDFSEPSKNRFEYKLDGFDKDWLSAGTANIARYTNIDPGNYKFMVRGSNDDGVWNKTGASVKLFINPPFWRTWWFYLIVGITIIVSGYSIYNFRMNKLLEMERLRMRLASDLHDELATNLSSISMFSNLILNNSPGSEQFMKRIFTLSIESVEAIRDIIWAIDPKPETLESLLIRFRDITVPICKAKKIKLNFDILPKDGLPSYNLSPELRKNFWLITKEAVNNACKHSECSELSINTTYVAGQLTTKIIDNGKGFDLSSKYEGKGIGTMKMRVKELRGGIDIESDLGSGTKLIFSIKI